MSDRRGLALALIFTFLGTAASAETLIPGVHSIKILPEAGIEGCASDQVTPVLDAHDSAIVQLCHRSYKACLLDGGCEVVTASGKVMISFEKYDAQKGHSYFSKVDTDRCPYGLGVQEVCIDPYFSVSADRTQAKLGDVIFVPALVGVKLPTGETHNGYLIVRDFADGNTGSVRGVMDIQVGPVAIDSSNILSQMGFEHARRHFEYRLVTGTEAQNVLKNRNFPLIPSSALKGEGK